jgi:hypothetical protein
VKVFLPVTKLYISICICFAVVTYVRQESLQLNHFGGHCQTMTGLWASRSNVTVIVILIEIMKTEFSTLISARKDHFRNPKLLLVYSTRPRYFGFSRSQCAFIKTQANTVEQAYEDVLYTGNLNIVIEAFFQTIFSS